MSTCSDNSASTLTLLQQNERYVDFIDAIERVTGDIHDVNVREHLGKLEVELTKTDGTVLSPSQVSHGTLRSIDLMLALMQPQDLVLFGYEEPEVHVHPAMATLLVELLIEASAREQVLITTHSPDVLRQVGPDDVRVVSKADGYTTVAPLLERQRRAVHERLLGLDDIQRLEGLRPQPLVAAT
jgi:predicted ATPase